MPWWGRRHSAETPRGGASGQHSDDEQRVQLIKQLADQQRFLQTVKMRGGSAAWMAREPGRTRSLMYRRRRPEQAPRVVATYESPGSEMQPDDALRYLQLVLDTVVSPESRAGAAGWVLAHPQGGILKLPDLGAVVAWKESAGTSQVSLVTEFARQDGHQPSDGQARIRTSPITVPAVMAFASEEGLEWAETVQIGEVSEGTCRARGQDGSVRHITYQALDNSLVGGLRVFWESGSKHPDLDAGWAFMDRALTGLLPEAERQQALELARRRLAQEELSLPSGHLLVAHIEAGNGGHRVVWVWARAEETDGQRLLWSVR